MATVTVPGVGGVDRRVVIGVGAAGAAFVGWRYWQARGGSGSSGDREDGTVTDGDFGAIDSAIPGVLGAVSPTNAYGSDTGEDTTNTVDTYGFHGTTNAQWTQYATTQLTQSARWSYTDIVTALGNYLSNRPVNETQQSIVQAAIAVAGYPPVGSFQLVPGGSTKITIAPINLHVVGKTKTSITVAFNPVAGAASYRAYRGVGANVGSATGPQITVAGLKPHTHYRIYVRAVTASGATGPQSHPVSATTNK